MLDRHPDMAVPPETYLFFIKNIYTSLRSFTFTKDQWTKAFFAETRVKEIGTDFDTLVQDSEKEVLNFKDLIRLILGQYAMKAGKSRVGEKTPQHLTYVPEIMDWYPGAKVICIIRDGRDVVESLMRMPWAPRNLRRHCQTWIAACKLIRKYQNQYPHRIMLVRFEDLVEAPRETLSKIDKFIGLSFHRNQLDHTQTTGVMLKKDNAWMGRINKKLDSGRIGIWKKEFTPVQKNILNNTMGRYLKDFGYGETSIPSHSSLNFINEFIINRFLNFLYNPTFRRVLYFLKLVTTGANPGFGNEKSNQLPKDSALNLTKDFINRLYPSLPNLVSWPRFIMESRRYLSEGWPVVPHPYVKRSILISEAKRIKADTFVETGTFLGDTSEILSKVCNAVHTIEIEPNLTKKAKKRFEKRTNIHVWGGDSALILPKVMLHLNSGNVLFWLDGHYSGGITGGQEKQNPIWNEIKAISESKESSNFSIFIDDANSFGSDPSFPKIHDLMKFVKKRFPNHEIYVENNIIKISKP